MLSYLDACLLGLLQGITEFVPISSTAHLRLYATLSSSGVDPGAAYSAVIQLGSLVALLFYFRKDLYRILCDIFQDSLDKVKHNRFSLFSRPNLSNLSKGSHLAMCIGLGTLPICLAGLAFADWIRGPGRSIEIVGTSLITVALWLIFAEYWSRRNRELTDITLKSSLAIGLAQCLALVPGASRSGTTLALGLCLHFNRSAALRFSFLLSIPAIGISGFYELISEFDELEKIGLANLGLASFISILSSYICISLLLRFVRKHSILIFAIYRIALGSFVLLWLAK